MVSLNHFYLIILKNLPSFYKNGKFLSELILIFFENSSNLDLVAIKECKNKKLHVDYKACTKLWCMGIVEFLIEKNCHKIDVRRMTMACKFEICE